MGWIDWLILGGSIAIVAVFSCRTQKYVRSVTDFLAAGRTGKRYLLTSANGLAGMGLITLVAYTQKFHHAGWAISWWNEGAFLLIAILNLSGFVYYRYRQTRALTLAQFFEMRYDRGYRIVMGAICFLAGILNFGIFPAIGARFFICFLGLPETLCGIPTYPLMMFFFLGGALLIAASGGQVQNMVTDTVQALFVYTMCVVVAITVLCLFSWGEFREVLLNHPPGKSFINPFDTAEIADFNFWFFLINLYFVVAQFGAWQGNQGYAASAVNPHEAKMGNILSTWRQVSITLFNTVFALGALTVLLGVNYQQEAAALLRHLSETLSPQVADQMSMPMALSEVLPLGIRGMFAAVLFFFMLSTDTTYIHSWGVIFVQDIVLPAYGKPVSCRTHFLLLRLSLIGVALFAFLFSWFYQQSEYINMFQMLTGVIFSAGAGCAIIGGLYWKRAGRASAWGGTIVGFLLAMLAIVLLDVRGWRVARGILLEFFPENAVLLAATEKCPINGAYLSLIATVAAQIVFVLFAFLNRKPFNLDRLLHRGAYADPAPGSEPENGSGNGDGNAGDCGTAPEKKKAVTPISWYRRLFLGFDEEFSRGDKWVSVSVSCWVFFWGGAFIVITAWNVLGYLFPGSFIRMWPDEWWFNWFMFYLGIHTLLAPVTAVWMTWGGVRDLREMFRLLRECRHSTDDGYVERKEN